MTEQQENCRKIAATLAQQIIDDLLTNGFGERAATLTLTRSDGRELGGWSEDAARKRITAIVEAALALIREGKS